MLELVDESDFLGTVLASRVNPVVLERAPSLGVGDWWLTGGAVFQAVWNRLDGRDPDAGVLDRDLFYFDPSDLSWEVEDAWCSGPQRCSPICRRRCRCATRLGCTCGSRAASVWRRRRSPPPGTRSTTCCYGVTRGAGGFEVYAPHGFADLASRRVRPNPGPATCEVYETKTARWRTEWPSLTVEPWPDGVP